MLTDQRFPERQRCMNKRETGKEKEQAACQWLEDHGCTILEKNYHAGRYGEIDIIAMDEGILAFVEVKYRSGDACGDPFEAVDHRKMQRISRVADRYLAEHGLSPDTACRFDVIGMTPEWIRRIPDAFSYVPARIRR